MEGHLAVAGTEAERIASLEYSQAARASVVKAYRLAGYLLGDSVEAQDAVQDALIKAWQNWDRLRDQESFSPWFDRIVVNVCRDRMRQRGRVRMVDLETADGVEASDAFGAMFNRDRLGSAVARLGDDQRIVIALRFWRDLTVDQVAEVLDVPAGTVKSRLHYALRALRAERGGSSDEA